MSSIPGRPHSIGIWGLASLMLVPILAGIAFGSPTPVLSQISAHFATTPGVDTLVRAMLTSLGAVMVVGAPITALLSERFGERRVLIWALALFALSGAAGAVLDNLWLLVGSRIVVGFALAATGVTGLTLLTNSVADDQRNRWLGIFTVTGSLGSVVVMLLAGLLGSINWRLVFLLHLFALPILAMIILSTRQPEITRERAEGPGARSRFPLTITLLGIICGAVTTTLPMYVPFHLRDVGEIDPARVAGPMTAGIFSGAMASLCYGWIRRHLGAPEIFAICFLLAGVGTGIVAWSNSLEVAVAGMVVSGLSTGLIAPNLFSVAAEAEPARRARRIGLARAGYYGAPLLAQIALEPVAISLGASGALFAIAGFATVMIAVTLLGRRVLLAA